MFQLWVGGGVGHLGLVAAAPPDVSCDAYADEIDELWGEGEWREVE